MDVPSDPGSTNCDQNDDPRPQKWRPQASKMPGLSFQLTSSHRSTNQQWGGRRQGAKPLRIRRARPWPAVGVVSGTPRKVPTFPEGNPGVCALCRRPTQQRSKITFFLPCSKNPKNVAKLPPRGSPNGANNLKNLKKMHSGCLLKRKLGKLELEQPTPESNFSEGVSWGNSGGRTNALIRK